MSTADVPERLGPYQIIRRLAYGGMAEVFLGKLRGADGFVKQVVIKRILPQHSENGEFIRMFRDEARITSQLFHGNIVQVIEFGEHQGQHHLVLEYVDGPSLSVTLATLRERSKRLSIVEAAHIAGEVARALDYAHRKRDAAGVPLQVVHRDVTPSNILLSREGEVKLADFGIARARARLATTATDSGVLKGKLAYMAPETLLLGNADALTDLFALGAVLYAMLTGEPAFRGESEAETISRIIGASPRLPSELNPDVPPELDALVARLLSKERETRPQRALIVADELARIVPLGEVPAEALAKTLASLGLPRRDRAERSSVLVVHESRTVRAVLRSRLESRYAVTEATGVDEALERVRKEPPDVVLCQHALTASVALCQRMRKDERTAKVKCVVLASRDSTEVRADATAQGAYGVVTQSMPTSEIQALLDVVLR
jgi:serine/threonine protein kinase